MTTLCRLVSALSLVLTLAPPPAGAAGIALDPSFGTSGKAFTDFAGQEDGPALLLQPDGRMVAVGSTAPTEAGPYDVAIARYQAGGGLDTSFGTGGKVKSDLFGGSELAFNGALQADGKVVVSGYLSVLAADDFQDAFVARFKANGTLDTAFGQNGRVRVDLGVFEQLQGLLVQPDQKIVAAGAYADLTGSFGITVLRLASNGSFDPTFGTGGKTQLALPGGRAALVFKALLQPDGKILVVGGSSSDLADRDPFVARLLPSGALDTGFAQGGFAMLPVAGDAVAADVTVQPDGKILLAGYVPQAGGSATDVAVWRLHPGGGLDHGFDGDGRAQTDFSGLHDYGLALVLQADGRIVVAGGANAAVDVNQPLPAGHTALVRYLANGAPDGSFGTGGKQVFALTGEADEAYDLAVQPDGKLLVSGAAMRSSVDFVVSRYQTSGGGDTSPCLSTATSLCLRGRFAVTATFDTGAQSGTAHAVGMTTDTGYFWFFNSQNVEVVVKVIDGCGLNSKYWVFAGGLTDVGTVLTVRDSQTGSTRTYSNPRGTKFAPIQDTAALAVCP